MREADGHVWQETGRLRMENEASLGRAAELAGLPLGQMITILTEFGVESRLEKDDSTYKGLGLSIKYGDHSAKLRC